MTEVEWLTCNDPWPILESLRAGRATESYGLAACSLLPRRFRPLLGKASRSSRNAREKFADRRCDGDSC